MNDNPYQALLVLMGSGETTPSLANTHRQIFERIGPGYRVLLDTPYGFQENADIITQKAQEYFSLALNQTVQSPNLRRMDRLSNLELETAQAAIRRANWVFSGPGSPSYVLGQWRESFVPSLLKEKLKSPGALVFASAAATVLGSQALPVYEIYKVGQDPHWVAGLDILGQVGLSVAVLPHYNNSSGGNHDTRFCYMGQRHLSTLESMLEAEQWILGIDEHTALLIDLAQQRFSVEGKGCVTVKGRGEQRQLWPGAWYSLQNLHPTQGQAPATSHPEGPAVKVAQVAALAPLLEDAQRLEKEFRRNLSHRQVTGALSCLLELEQTLAEWSADTDHISQSNARAIFRSLMVELAETAQKGTEDPVNLLKPFVDPLMELRQRARVQRDWDTADWLRKQLVEAGVEIQDTPQGARWELRA